MVQLYTIYNIDTFRTWRQMLIHANLFNFKLLIDKGMIACPYTQFTTQCFWVVFVCIVLFWKMSV